MNDDEVVDFARKTMEDGWNVRFIELMPLGDGVMEVGDWRQRVVTAGEIRKKIESAWGALEPAKVTVGGGPARYYRLPGTRGTIGFITPISEHFCYGCNRLRLTADGKLRPCLLSGQEIDLRSVLRAGADVEDQNLSAQPGRGAGPRNRPARREAPDCRIGSGRDRGGR